MGNFPCHLKDVFPSSLNLIVTMFPWSFRTIVELPGNYKRACLGKAGENFPTSLHRVTQILWVQEFNLINCTLFVGKYHEWECFSSQLKIMSKLSTIYGVNKKKILSF